MSKSYRNSRAEQVWEDLERYLDFCRDYGYRFNEADLYNNKKYPYQQFRKFVAGKNAKDMWSIDSGRGRRQ